MNFELFLLFMFRFQAGHHGWDDHNGRSHGWTVMRSVLEQPLQPLVRALESLEGRDRPGRDLWVDSATLGFDTK
jgi:hypothetical protein